MSFGVYNARTGAELAARCAEAATFWTRLVGLLGRAALPEGEGLWLTRCNSVHNFGMRFAIDVAFLDAEGVVIRTLEPLGINRASPVVRKAKDVLELPVGTLARTGTVAGDRLERRPGR